MALGTPVAAATAYSTAGGTSVSPAYPAGILATDAVLLFIGQKPLTANVNGGTVTTPSGWTLRDELLAAGGYGTTIGADTGNTNLRVYSWNTPVAGQTGNLAVTVGQNEMCWAFMVRIPSGGGAITFGSADGQRTTAPTVNVAFTVNLTNGATATNFQTGDRAIWAMCIPTDVTTPGQFSAQSVTATGATFGAATELNEPDSQLGNDIGGYSAWAAVTAGSSTAAPSVTVTAGGTVTNVRGPIVLVRVREAPVAQTLTPSLFTNTQTFHNSTVVQEQFLTPALFTNNQTFYSADITQSGGAQDLQPQLYTNAQTFYSPAVTTSYAIEPARYDNAQTFYPPTLTNSYALQPALYSNTQTFYGPVVTQTGGAQTLLPDLYTNAQAFYSPTVGRGAVVLQPGLYTNNQTFYSPEVKGSNTLSPAIYTNTQAFYAPTVGIEQFLTPGLFTNSQTFYSPAVSQGATQQDITFEDYVDVGYVEPDYVTWVASFQGGNQFFPPALQQFAQRGDGWMPQMDTKLRKRIKREREQKEELRRLIEQAVDPVQPGEKAKVVVSEDKGVAVITEARAIAIPAPPEFDASAVARQVMAVLKAANIEAQRVRDAQTRRFAAEVLRRAQDDVRRKIIKRRRDDEFLLLMG